jgi:hypothetical protein
VAGEHLADRRNEAISQGAFAIADQIVLECKAGGIP